MTPPERDGAGQPFRRRAAEEVADAATSAAWTGISTLFHADDLRRIRAVSAAHGPPALNDAHAFWKRGLRKPDAGKPHVRFDEGVLETGSWCGLRHRQRDHPQAKSRRKQLSPASTTTAPVPYSTPIGASSPETSAAGLSGRSGGKKGLRLSRGNFIQAITKTAQASGSDPTG